MAKALTIRGCKVTVMPAASTAEDILAICPDGVLLSNGPGDPAVNVDIIANLRRLTAFGVPIMGICLGHQLLALALGAKTEKLKFGHRGANQPVRDTQNGRLFITSQNHGYAVVNHTLPKGADLWFENLNDTTCEGIEYTGFPAFSVQFHPEACAGPLDTTFLFDRFLSMIKGEPHAQK
jgi:carbamoyl-phosphate synthase small subunit